VKHASVNVNVERIICDRQWIWCFFSKRQCKQREPQIVQLPKSCHSFLKPNSWIRQLAKLCLQTFCQNCSFSFPIGFISFFFMSYLSLCWLTIPANVNAAWQTQFPVVWVLFFATTPITSMLPQPVPPHHSQSKKTESSISIKEQLTAQLSPGKTPLSDLKLKW